MKQLTPKLNVAHQRMVRGLHYCAELYMLYIEIFSLVKENVLLQSRLLDYEVQLESNQRYKSIKFLSDK